MNELRITDSLDRVNDSSEGMIPSSLLALSFRREKPKNITREVSAYILVLMGVFGVCFMMWR